MTGSRNFLSVCGALGVALLASSAGALADGYEVAAPAAVDEGRKFTYSFNIGGTSDYVFRGVSQTDNDPAIQGGARLQLRHPLRRRLGLDGRLRRRCPPANAEVDWYGGIKPTWNSPFGTINLDFGVIYYSYPGANPTSLGRAIQLRGAEGRLQLVGAASEPGDRHHGLLVAGLLRSRPGSVWTIETMAAWTLPKFRVFTPVINGVLGWQKGDCDDGYFVNVNGTDDEYYYWNAGLALAVENITFDFRYWDTNIGGDAGGPFCAERDLCDERFVFSAKVVVP